MTDLTLAVDAVYADTFSVVRTNDPLFTNTRNDINSSTYATINGTTYKLVLRHYDLYDTHMFFWIVKPGYEATYGTYYSAPYDFGGGYDAWDLDPVAWVASDTLLEAGQQITFNYTPSATTVSTLNSLTIDGNSVNLAQAAAATATVSLNTYQRTVEISYVVSNVNATVDISGNSLVAGNNPLSIIVSGSSTTIYTVNVIVPKPSYNDINNFLVSFYENNLSDFILTNGARSHTFNLNAVYDMSGVTTADLIVDNINYGRVTDLSNVSYVLFGIHNSTGVSDYTSAIIYFLDVSLNIYDTFLTNAHVSLNISGVTDSSIGIYNRRILDSRYAFLFNSNRNNNKYEFDLSGSNINGEFKSGFLNNNNKSSDTSLSIFTVNGNNVSDGDSINLANGTTNVTVIAVPTNVSATVDISGASGLVTGSQTCIVTVTAEDESVQSYTLTLNVASLAVSLNTFENNPASITNDVQFNIETNSQVFEMKKKSITTDISGNKTANVSVEGKSFSVSNLPATASDIIIGHNTSESTDNFITKIVVLDSDNNQVTTFDPPLTFTLYFPGATTPTIPIYTQQSLEDEPVYETTGISIGNSLYTFTINHLTYIKPGYSITNVNEWNLIRGDTINRPAPRSCYINKRNNGDIILAFTHLSWDVNNTNVVFSKVGSDQSYGTILGNIPHNTLINNVGQRINSMIIANTVIKDDSLYLLLISTHSSDRNRPSTLSVFKTNFSGQSVNNTGLWVYRQQNVYISPIGSESGEPDSLSAFMEVDSNGNVYVVYLNNERKIIMYKLNNSGTLSWISTNESINTNPVRSVDFKMDISGNIYIAYADSSRFRLAKFNNAGELVWKSNTNEFIDKTNKGDFIRLGIDAMNSLYVTYYVTGGSGVTKPVFLIFKVVEIVENDILKCKLEWNMDLSTMDVTIGEHIFLIPSASTTDENGNTYITYYYYPTNVPTIDTTYRNISTMKINSSGAILWDFRYNMGNRGPNALFPLRSCSHVIHQNNIYTAGSVDNFFNNIRTRRLFVANLRSNDPTAPDIPTNLIATPSSGTSISLSWTAPASFGTFSNFDKTTNSELKNYRVFMNGSLILNTNITSTSYVVTGLIPGISYTFRVSAINKFDLEGAKSLSVTTIIASVPSAPVITSADGAGTSATVTWTKPANGGATITGYTVTVNGTDVNVNGENTLTTTLTGLTTQTVYTVTVKAINSIGTSAASAEAKFYLFTFEKDSSILSNTRNLYSSYEVKTLDSPLLSFKTSNNKELSIIQARAAAKATNAIFNLTSNQQINLRRNINSSLRSKVDNTNILISSSNISKFLETFNNFSSDLNVATSITFVPQQIIRDADGPCVELDVENISSYKAVEIPINCKLILKSGATLVPLKFKGTYYEPWAGGAPINIGDQITVGSTNIKLFAVGSGIFGPGNNDGGGGNGDPYVTTISNDHYKLPCADIPIRFYQGMVGEKQLTVNATLRTVRSTEIIGSNLLSFMELKDKIPAKSQQKVVDRLFGGETMCFFEKVYVSYGDSHVVLNVWDRKFAVLAHRGDEIKSRVGSSATPDKYTKEYKNYANTTLTLYCDTAKVHVSVYDSEIVRNGIFVEAPHMEAGNGVIVNTLSRADMTLGSLMSDEPVPNRDTAVKTHRETFIDARGMRIRTIAHV